jgi:ParB family chromosome partitioning protein
MAKKSKNAETATEVETVVETQEATTSPKKRKEKVNHPHELPITAISEIKDFNPRSSLGDITDLTTTVRKNGILQPILVRPHPEKANKYQLIDGHRRYAAAKDAKLVDVPVYVRDDLANDADALAAAISTGSDVTRKNLEAVDEAVAFKKLLDSGFSPAKIAGITGYSGQHVRNRLALLDLRAPILERVKDKTLANVTAVTLAKMDEEIQDKILPELTENSTANDVKVLYNKLVKEEAEAEANANAQEETGEEDGGINEGAGSKSSSRKTLPEKGVFKVPQSKKEIAAKISDIIADAEQTDDEAVNNALINQAAALFWATGEIEELKTTGSAFKKAYKAVTSTFQYEDVPANEDDADEVSASDEKPAKKAKGKKAKAVEAEEEGDDE